MDSGEAPYETDMTEKTNMGNARNHMTDRWHTSLGTTCLHEFSNAHPPGFIRLMIRQHKYDLNI